MVWPFSSLLEEKFQADVRPVDAQVELFGMTFAYAAPILLFWVQIGIYLMIQSCVNLVMGCIIWKYVVQQRQSSSTTTTTTTTAWLVSFGVAIPVSLYLPFQLIPFLDIRNTTLLITLAAQAPLIVFRCLQGE